MYILLSKIDEFRNEKIFYDTKTFVILNVKNDSIVTYNI